MNKIDELVDLAIDVALMRAAENILKISSAIEAGTMQDLGSVQSLRIVASAIIQSAKNVAADE